MPFTVRPVPSGGLVVGLAYGDVTYQDFIDGFDEALSSGHYQPGTDNVNVFMPDARAAPIGFHAMLRLQERVRAAELAGREKIAFRAVIVANTPREREIAEAYAALWGDSSDGDASFHVSDDLAKGLEWLGHADAMGEVRATISAIAQDPSGPNLSAAEAEKSTEQMARSAS